MNQTFETLRQRCNEDIMVARAVERLCREYNLPSPHFQYREVPAPCRHPGCPSNRARIMTKVC